MRRALRHFQTLCDRDANGRDHVPRAHKTLTEPLHTDQKVVAAMFAGALMVLFAALVNRYAKLGMLSTLTERVTFVLMPPLMLIFRSSSRPWAAPRRAAF